MIDVGYRSSICTFFFTDSQPWLWRGCFWWCGNDWKILTPAWTEDDLQSLDCRAQGPDSGICRVLFFLDIPHVHRYESKFCFRYVLRSVATNFVCGANKFIAGSVWNLWCHASFPHIWQNLPWILIYGLAKVLTEYCTPENEKIFQLKRKFIWTTFPPHFWVPAVHFPGCNHLHEKMLIGDLQSTMVQPTGSLWEPLDDWVRDPWEPWMLWKKWTFPGLVGRWIFMIFFWLMILVMSCITTFPAKISGYIFKYVSGLCLVISKWATRWGLSTNHIYHHGKELLNDNPHSQ